MPAPDDFPALIAAAQRGDRAAVEELYRGLNPFVLRYLRAQEPGEADDLAADVWEAALAGLDRFEGGFEGGEDGLRAWLFTIARRRVSDVRRQRQRRRTDVVSPTTISDQPSAMQTDAVVLEQLSAQAAIDRLIRRLPAVQAEVVLLRVVGGLSVDQVAAILDRSPGAVRVLQHRALKRLAEQHAPSQVTP